MSPALGGDSGHRTAAPRRRRPGSGGGPTAIFSDGFESGGTCRWLASNPCTTYIITIPLGTGAGDHGFPATIDVDLGATLHFVNADTTLHQIHSDDMGVCGFPHQQTSMSQGEEYVVTPTCVGSYP